MPLWHSLILVYFHTNTHTHYCAFNKRKLLFPKQRVLSLLTRTVSLAQTANGMLYKCLTTFASLFITIAQIMTAQLYDCRFYFTWNISKKLSCLNNTENPILTKRICTTQETQVLKMQSRTTTHRDKLMCSLHNPRIAIIKWL